MAKFLFLECRSGLTDKYGNPLNELWFASCLAKDVADRIRRLGHDVKEVEAPDPDTANKVIAEYDPDVVWWIGHGWCCAITLENLDIWVETPLDKCYVMGEEKGGCSDEINEDVFAGRVAGGISCLTGQYLAQHLSMKHGCIAYLGYEDVFLFNYLPGCACGNCTVSGVRSEVLKAAMTCMHDANLHFVYGLAQGMSVKEAYEFSLSRFDEWIEWFESLEPVSEVEKAIIRLTILILDWDKMVQVVYGNLDYKLEKPVPPPVKLTPAKFGLGMWGWSLIIPGISKLMGR